MDATGYFIIGNDSTPMKLWQHADACGKLHYSLLPAMLDDACKTEEGISVLRASSLVSVKVEGTDCRLSDHLRIGGCDFFTRRYADSSTRSRKLIVGGYTCDRCDTKFPMQSMLNRHRVTHNARARLRERHSLAKQRRYARCPKTRPRRDRPTGRAISLKRTERARKRSCALCDFVCDRTTTLAAHVRRKHRKEEETRAKKLSCTICDYECTSEVVLNRHTLKHRSKKSATDGFACDLCNFECKRSTTLASHLARNHQKDNREKGTPNSSSRAKNAERRRATTKRCSFQASSRRFSLASAVDSHRRGTATAARQSAVAVASYEDSDLVIKEEAIKEEVCAEECDEAPAGNAADPTKTSGPDRAKDVVDKEVRCDLCDFTCAKKRTLYSHKRRHKEGEVYACNECSFKTGKKSSLYSHIKRKHKELRGGDGGGGSGDPQQPELFYCSQCDYKNKNKYELKVHVARKHSDDFKFSCETCGKKFKVKGDLTNHIRFSHREQPVICDVCGKTCLNSNSLYVHQKFAHYKAKYECQVCKRRMVSQENLNEHMLRQHERRENVVCEECGKTFSRNSRLKVHMRIHTGDKPYSCTVCNKAFARRTALKQHLLIHTGIRPYVCDICGKAFTQKPGLISHRKSHPGSHPPLPRVLIDHILNDVMNA